MQKTNKDFVKNTGKKESMRDKVGDAVEKLGDKVSGMGAEKLGKKIHNLGDKIEKDHGKKTGTY
jgi:hypothetical protein